MLIAGGAGFYFGQQALRRRLLWLTSTATRTPSRVPEHPEPIYKIPVGDAVTKGNPEALVTIVEVSDCQCPFCNRVNKTIDSLMKGKYGKDLRVFFASSHNREPAAIAAERPSGQVLEMRKLFANYKTSGQPGRQHDRVGGRDRRIWTSSRRTSRFCALRRRSRRNGRCGQVGAGPFFIGRFLSSRSPSLKR